MKGVKIMKTYSVDALLAHEKFQLANPGVETNKEIGSVYIGDLLSWVMSHSEQNCAWITVQTHINIVAVAVLLEMSCIILPEGCTPDEDTQKKALEENIPLLVSPWTAYNIACFLKEKMES